MAKAILKLGDCCYPVDDLGTEVYLIEADKLTGNLYIVRRTLSAYNLHGYSFPDNVTMELLFDSVQGGATREEALRCMRTRGAFHMNLRDYQAIACYTREDAVELLTELRYIHYPPLFPRTGTNLIEKSYGIEELSQ